MDTSSAVAMLQQQQAALATLSLLQLTGYLFPPDAKLKDGDSFDYIIVGGGSAGSVVATRLVQQEYNVLVIEAGTDTPIDSLYPVLEPYLKNSRIDWAYNSSDYYISPYYKKIFMNMEIGKTLGGSGEISELIYSRGNPYTYDQWARITSDNNWSWENSLPYFIKVENVTDSGIANSSAKYNFGTEGYIGITRSKGNQTKDYIGGFQQLGISYINDIDGNRVGYSQGLKNVKNRERQSAGLRYLRKIKHSPYIAIAKNTLATKINFDKYRNAVSVEVITPDNQRIIVKANKEIIVAAGAIKTPQILMLSGLGPKNHLDSMNVKCIADLPVGKNLQNHVAAVIPYKTNKPLIKEKVNLGDYPPDFIVSYVSLPKSDKNSYLKGNPEYETMSYVMNNMTLLLQFCKLGLNFEEAVCDKLYAAASKNQVLLTLLSNLYPYSRGEILLRSTDPEDSPIIFSGTLSDDRDLENFVDYITDYIRIDQSDAFKRAGVSLVDLSGPKCDRCRKGSRDYWRCYISSLLINMEHHSGTCAMNSVVDSRLRVKLVKRLRVVDASVMPTIPSGNIYHPVLMVAEKAAEIIMEDAGMYNAQKHNKVNVDYY